MYVVTWNTWVYGPFNSRSAAYRYWNKIPKYMHARVKLIRDPQEFLDLFKDVEKNNEPTQSR